MDKIKKKVAHEVQAMLLHTNWNAAVQPIGDRLNRAIVLGELNTGVTIWTEEGPRHFNVKVSETI